jgi:HK97 family phage prohead protease
MDGEPQDDPQPGPSTVHEEELSSVRRRVSFARQELAITPDEPSLIGYLIRWDTVTDRGTFFKKSAFTKTIAEKPATPHLWQHWGDLIIGVNKEPVQDRNGLKIKVAINEEDELGRRVMGTYRHGQQHGWVPDWSIGFNRIKDRTATDDEYGNLDFSGAGPYKNAPASELRALLEVSWDEGSTVTWGALHGAGPDIVNSRYAAATLDLAAFTVAAREGRLTPEQLAQVEELKAAIQTRAGAGATGHHSTPPVPPARQVAAELDLLFFELGIPTEQAA